jgi:hypothetical protein
MPSTAELLVIAGANVVLSRETSKFGEQFWRLAYARHFADEEVNLPERPIPRDIPISVFGLGQIGTKDDLLLILTGLAG